MNIDFEATNRTVMGQEEVSEPVYPDAPDGLSVAAAALSKEVIWDRLEQFTNYKIGQRSIQFRVWSKIKQPWWIPAERPFEITEILIADTNLEDYVAKIVRPRADGAVNLGGKAALVTALIGSTTAPPLFLEAYKRLAEYYAAPLQGEGISQAIPIRGTKKFSLYKKTKNEEGEEIFKPTLEATLTGAAKEYLIVLSRKKNQPIKAIVHSLALSNLSANKVHLFNYSPVDLGIDVEDEQYVVKQNKRMSHGFKVGDRNKYTSAKVVMRYKDEIKVMASKRLRLIPGRRIIFICFDSAKRTKLGSTPLGMVTIQDKP